MSSSARELEGCYYVDGTCLPAFGCVQVTAKDDDNFVMQNYVLPCICTSSEFHRKGPMEFGSDENCECDVKFCETPCGICFCQGPFWACRCAGSSNDKQQQYQTQITQQAPLQNTMTKSPNRDFAKQYGTELFHQTDQATAEIILRTQEMKPGKKGLAGGGIYFATSQELTGHKAHAHGVILKAYVRLGKILTLEPEGDTKMTLGKLKSHGFDSVCIARKVSSGQEYVVYDPTQVLLIERA
eukprot:gnl/MRDRNA2_/MRDRNA2_16191_c0_seq1.p1 gnl/MRDRNA2_/MRDRNA2_16191_c0~~gnl/MRDRNA2_/MRDRNA2_16191_c0_seq1.p1  ORF type:complete len:241 (-),score=30.93 gnl/MRDRNA2_/MRDRNA2_16191_c0_seq1:69-791(-)